MEDKAKLAEFAQSVRTSAGAKGRTYSDTGIDPKWLANEIAEYCKTQGWGQSLNDVSEGKVWLILADKVAALVEGTSTTLDVKVTDLNPVRLKSALASTGLLALTGAGLVAVPLAGVAIWRSQSRKAKVDSIVEFVDERVQSRAGKASTAPASGSVVDRMKELAALRDQGLITSEEYEAKKQELMRAL